MWEAVPFPIDSEDAVKTLFVLLSGRLGYRILGVGRTGFDYLLADKDGRVFNAEVEFFASEFIRHRHPVEECGLLVCWIDDWQDCPIPKLTLSEIVTCFEGLTEEELEKFNAALKLQMKVIEKLHRLIKDVEVRLLNFNQNLALQNPPEQLIRNPENLPLKEAFTWRDKSLRREILEVELDIPGRTLTLTGILYPETCQDREKLEELFKYKPARMVLRNVREGVEETVEDVEQVLEGLTRKNTVLRASWKLSMDELAKANPPDAVMMLTEKIKEILSRL